MEERESLPLTTSFIGMEEREKLLAAAPKRWVHPWFPFCIVTPEARVRAHRLRLNRTPAMSGMNRST
jgi:hypothetical protein